MLLYLNQMLGHKADKLSLFGVRHLQCVLLFLAMVFAFSMNVHMSLAIIAMTDNTQENTFDWDLQVQSVILSSYFWGYVVLQIPGGELAARFGGMTLVSVSIGVNSILTLLIPTAASYGGWLAVCACRVLQGLTQGFLYPSMHTLIGKWVPLEEKSRLGSLIYAGAQLGTAIQLMAAGFITRYWGWPAIFYVTGTLGLVWTILYQFLGADSPRNSKLIGDFERDFIEKSLGQTGEIVKKLPTPWKSIFTSVPFLALIITHCGHNWGFWTLMTETPSFMNQVLNLDIRANGLMSALPYLTIYLLSFPLGFMSDYILNKKWMTLSACRKLMNSIGQFGPAIALIGLSYVPSTEVVLTVAMLVCVVGLNAGYYSGFFLVHIDMAPNFAGTLMGITNCIANLVAMLAPIAVGSILQDETDPAEWRKVFFLASAIYVICNIVFITFCTSERQPWNEITEPTNIEENKTDTKS